MLAVIGFAVRPYFQTVRGETDPATISYVAELQKLAHLAIDPPASTPKTACTG